MKCPICQNEIKNHDVDYMEHILMEEHATCTDEHHFYSYEFVTGDEREVLGGIEVYRHHTDPPERRRIQDRVYKVAKQLERQSFLKNKEES